MGSSRKSSNRPKKRTLVRWDGTFPAPIQSLSLWHLYKPRLTDVENLNELLLLTVQSVCNTNSIKIPWADVARTMGHNVTEGAIVQHLAKLRSRRVAAEKAVPPPLRRGGIGALCKSTAESPTGSVQGERPKRKSAQTKLGSGESRSKAQHQDTSSDEDWVEGRASRIRRKFPNKKKSISQAAESTPEQLKYESDEDDIDSSVNSSNDLLAPGAKFLEYPNDTGQPETSPSASGSEPKRSKLVVLKYRRHASNDGDTVSHSVGLAVDPGNLHDAASFPQYYQQSSGDNAYSVDSNANFMDLLSQDSPMGFAPVGSSSMEVLSHEPGVAAHGDLWQSGLGQPFSSAMYPAYHNTVDVDTANDPLDFSQEMFNRLASFEPETYQHMSGNYMQMDEAIHPYQVSNDMK
ncbi:hypothetical protein BO94DRAFT_532902 [Aspergillus sclerotioniger CBS 115572]|uniref:Uncharacterized protein n=1 Tax=Aspergillus sclerotioniger CBS 115572 TaxID=1450535 RepID=A0A317X3F0_9EURO|nr:hypothetical protein BO94DRAFT_532902 [Aspergillus sclerotioniger CBS 115572]PWY93164.1 hypothetical protein BO94DRAFT_532902 [Aspergillus sclerotioniger CBS 115572]